MVKYFSFIKDVMTNPIGMWNGLITDDQIITNISRKIHARIGRFACGGDTRTNELSLNFGKMMTVTGISLFSDVSMQGIEVKYTNENQKVTVSEKNSNNPRVKARLQFRKISKEKKGFYTTYAYMRILNLSKEIGTTSIFFYPWKWKKFHSQSRCLKNHRSQ